jgi:hypothetical protein
MGNTPPMPAEGGSQLSELRQLLEECRAMSEEREDSMFAPMFSMGGMGGMMASMGGMGGMMATGSR